MTDDHGQRRQIAIGFSIRVLSVKGDKKGAGKGAEEEVLVFSARRSDSEAWAREKTVRELLGLNLDSLFKGRAKPKPRPIPGDLLTTPGIRLAY